MTEHTDSQRLKILLQVLEVKQIDIERTHGIAQTSISSMCKGIIPISKKLKKILYEKHKVNIEWLEYGIGSMLLESSENTLQDPPELYTIKKPSKTINDRFLEQWSVIVSRNIGITQKELCKKFNITDTDISKIKSNEITPTKTVLGILSSQANFNINYTLTGKGPQFIEATSSDLYSKVVSLTEENKTLIKTCQLLEENIELMREKLRNISANDSAKISKKTA